MINAIDHIVFTVEDIETTCEFYQRVLGMEVITFGEGRNALGFGRQKINLHQQGRACPRRDLTCVWVPCEPE